MLTVDRRRLLKLSGAALAFPTQILAQQVVEEDDDGLAITQAPQELGFADFSESWEFVGDPSILAPGVSNPLPDAIISKYAQKHLGTYIGGYTEFFFEAFGRSFEDIYNEAAGSGSGRRAKMKPISVEGQERLRQFWATYESSEGALPPAMGEVPPTTLLDFLIYTAIFIHETGGSISKAAERFNPVDPALEHPGIAYLYNRFRPRGSSYQKASYNKSPPNKTCLELFNDPKFINRFKDLKLSERVINTSDERWAGNKFPKNEFPTSGKSDISGILLEADFFKFRGRGLIQSTWRDNYRKLVHFLVDIDRDLEGSEIIRGWKALGVTHDEICTLSTNEEWDRLFAEDSHILSVAAVKLHAVSRRYTPVSSDPHVANSAGNNSILNFGKRINGSDEYAHELRQRVFVLSQAMGTDFD
ncbi:hypothetical protein I6F26_00375 [Ensifer sp. IC3342]|nr:hypothetical protein [Ensifer sp. BRP08]MCA1445050.1 hypothetical protein [Ensifer sp. IC3342]